jgi:uncharacterized protein
MDPQSPLSSLPPQRNTLHVIFFNERGLRAGWRLGIFLLVLTAIFFVIAIVVRMLVHLRGPSPADRVSPVDQLIAEVVTFAGVLFATWVMGLIEHRKVGEFGLPLERSALSAFVHGYILWGFLPLTLLLLALRALHAFYFGNIGLHGVEIVHWAAMWGLVFLFVGLAEEYLFRGYALHTLADGIGFWPAAIVLAALFALLHAGNSGESRIGLIGVALFALFASATIWRTGSLWLAVGAHAGWDWGESYFFGVSDSGAQAQGHLLNPHLAGPDWLSGGSVGPEGSVLTLVLLALMMVLFLVLYRPKRAELIEFSAR